MGKRNEGREEAWELKEGAGKENRGDTERRQGKKDKNGVEAMERGDKEMKQDIDECRQKPLVVKRVMV